LNVPTVSREARRRVARAASGSESRWGRDHFLVKLGPERSRQRIDIPAGKRELTYRQHYDGTEKKCFVGRLSAVAR